MPARKPFPLDLDPFPLLPGPEAPAAPVASRSL